MQGERQGKSEEEREEERDKCKPPLVERSRGRTVSYYPYHYITHKISNKECQSQSNIHTSSVCSVTSLSPVGRFVPNPDTHEPLRLTQATRAVSQGVL